MIYIFTTNNAIGSRLIRWGTRSKASHMIIARTPKKGSHCIEARGEYGVRERYLAQALKGNKVVDAFELELPVVVLDKMYRDVRSKVGAKYDFKGIGFFALSIAFFTKLLGIGRKKENKWADSEQWYCSEMLMINKKELSKYTNIKDYSEQNISPQDAIDILSKGDPNFINRIDLKLEMKLNA